MVGVIRFFVIFTKSEFSGWVETWEQKEQTHANTKINKPTNLEEAIWKGNN